MFALYCILCDIVCIGGTIAQCTSKHVTLKCSVQNSGCLGEHSTNSLHHLLTTEKLAKDLASRGGGGYRLRIMFC